MTPVLSKVRPAKEHISRSTETKPIHPNEIARTRWKAVLEYDCGNELALYQIASNSMILGDNDAAAESIKKLVNLKHVVKQHRLPELQAKQASQLMDHKRAIEYWKIAISKGFDENIGRQKIASQYLQLNMLDLARYHLNQIDTRVVDEQVLSLMEARCYIKGDQWQKAIDCLNSIDLDGNYRDTALKLLFQCYMRDSRSEKADLVCRLIEEDCAEKGIHFRGRWFFSQLNFDEAKKSFIESIELSQNPDSRVWLIKTLVTISAFDDARDQAKLAEKYCPDDLMLQARCWDAAGEMEQAEKKYLEAVNTYRREAEYISLVNFYLNNRFWGKAYSTIVDALNQDISSSYLSDKKADIANCMRLCGVRPPGLFFRKIPLEFLSTESIVSQIVDKIVKKQKRNQLKPDKTFCVSESTGRHIVIVINSLGSGGAERQAVNLANGLVALNTTDKVTLLCTHLSRRDQDRFYEPLVSSKVTIEEYYRRDEITDIDDISELNEYSDLLRYIQPSSRQRSLVQLSKALKKLKPDVVHAWLDETFINAALVCGMLSIPNVLGRWGSMPAGVNRTVTSRARHNIGYLEYAYKQLTRMENVRYTSNSRLTGDAYAEMMSIPKDQVQIVYNGVNVGSDICGQNISKREIGIPETAMVVGTVFRFSEEKRPDLWIDVAKVVAKTNPDVHFVLVGAGPMETEIADKIGCDSKFIHMVGKQSNVVHWYKMFDILLLTSRVEGVSNVVVESQYFGVPVVVPNVGGLSEAVLHRETGLLLEDDSVNSFANGIVELLQDEKKLADFGKNASEFAKKKFSQENMVLNYSRFFDGSR